MKTVSYTASIGECRKVHFQEAIQKKRPNTSSFASRGYDAQMALRNIRSRRRTRPQRCEETTRNDETLSDLGKSLPGFVAVSISAACMKVGLSCQASRTWPRSSCPLLYIACIMYVPAYIVSGPPKPSPPTYVLETLCRFSSNQ
jgi:hypothetical protein